MKGNLRRVVLASLPVFVTAFGCGGGGVRLSEGTKTTFSIAPGGGTYASTDSRFTLVVPAGVVTANRDGSFQGPVTVPGSQVLSGSGVILKAPEDLGSSTLTINYSGLNLNGASEADLKIGELVNVLPQTRGEVIVLTASTASPTTNSVSVPIDHPGTFVIVVPAG